MTQTTREIDLVVTNQHGRSTNLRMKPGSYLIGRGPGCQIRFPVENRAVSRQHARLAVDARGVRIEDLESHTGTMVNGKIVRVAFLEDQDVVSIAGYSLKVVLGNGHADAADDGPVDVFEEAHGISCPEDVESLLGELRSVRKSTARLMEVLGTRIVGQEEVLRSVWATILAKGHCLLVGVPGLAKTLMVSTFAGALGLQSKRIQFTPDLLPSDIIGSNVIHESEDGRRYFEFVQGPIFTQLLLADEINRTPPKTQSALLEAMQERQVTVGDKSLSLPEPFFVIATQNPIEQEGTYPLPEAQLDRFMLCVHLDYPSRDEEVDILIRTSCGAAPSVPEILSYREILQFQEVANQVVVPAEIAAYCADLVRATRPSDPRSPAWLRDVVEWGAGPRAGQSLIRIAKARAAMNGRPAIAREDVVRALVPSMRHRVSCNFRSRAEGLDEAAIARRIAEEVPFR